MISNWVKGVRAVLRWSLLSSLRFWIPYDENFSHHYFNRHSRRFLDGGGISRMAGVSRIRFAESANTNKGSSFGKRREGISTAQKGPRRSGAPRRRFCQ